MGAYENRTVPEGINVSPVHPLKDFAVLLFGVSLSVIAFVIVLALLAGYLVRYVPFSYEQSLVSRAVAPWLEPSTDPLDQQRQRYLQSLADRLSSVMNLPDGMQVTVHYVQKDTVNAMATLGGHVVVFQGLLDVMPNENALAMVLAHEMAHVRYRHPIVATGRGFAVTLALSALAGIGDGVMERWVGQMGILPILSFSRSQETEADALALESLQQSYGHVEGAAALFEYAAAETPVLSLPTLLATHPDHEDRIRRIQVFAQEHPPAMAPQLQPLPDYMKSKAKSNESQ